jgi:hypothetical protein
MPKPKLTPWFEPDQKPVHEGVYETRIPHCWGYCYWDGHEWMDTRPTAEQAVEIRRPGSQNKRWRGLANKP